MAGTWALQLSTVSPQACTPLVGLEHLPSGRWSRHSAAVCDFTLNHPSQQVPQVVAPSRAKDLLVVSPASSPFIVCPTLWQPLS